MKIFDSSPSIALARPRRRRLVVAVSAGVTAYIALATALLYQHAAYSAQLDKATRDLAASQSEVRRLRTSLASMEDKLGATNSDRRACASNLDAETLRVAAFARQAAACERIREALHVKG